MKEYSKIKSIEVRDFRGIQRADINFNGKNIITLMGDNEAGKTSIVKAIKTCTTNADGKKQKGYIRYYQDAFMVGIALEDGTEVLRYKSENKNYYKVKFSDGHIESFDKPDGLPSDIQSIFGLYTEGETGELLNIRTCDDPLIMSDTASSVNYKIIYGLLKAEDIYKAVQIGNKEVNAKKKDIDMLSGQRAYIEEQKKKIKILDMESLLNVKGQLIEKKSQLDLEESIKGLINTNREIIRQHEQLEKIENAGLKEIDTGDIVEIEKLLKSKKETISKKEQLIKGLNKTEEIDLTLINELQKALNEKQKIENLKSTLDDKLEKAQLVNIDDRVLEQLELIRALISANKEASDMINANNEEIAKAEEAMKEAGELYIKCPNCGEYILKETASI